MSTKRKSTQSTDHTHFNDLPELQQQTIFEMLALDLEFDYIIKSKRGDTKIRFSDNSYYKAESKTRSDEILTYEGTNFKYASSTYQQILKIVDYVLQSRYAHQDSSQNNSKYHTTTLPTGSLLFGRISKNCTKDTNRSNATYTSIDCKKD